MPDTTTTHKAIFIALVLQLINKQMAQFAKRLLQYYSINQCTGVYINTAEEKHCFTPHTLLHCCLLKKSIAQAKPAKTTLRFSSSVLVTTTF